jgi:prepilin-type N-terminal cleavage/methylation domain-containing protein
MTVLRNTRKPTLPQTPHRCGRRGFTLMELLVVIGVIALIAAVVVPSINSVFTAGSDAQAFNMMVGQLSAARSEAVQNGTFAALHVQLADAVAHPELKGTCYTAVFVYSHSERRFIPTGNLPRRMPGRMAFGEISTTCLDPSTGNFRAGVMNTEAGLSNFTSFSVVFSATGTAVMAMADVGNVLFKTGGVALFDGGEQKLWDPNVANASGSGEPPVTAMTLFDSTAVEKVLNSGGDPATYLNANKQLLPINVHTGQFFPRQ